MRIAFISTYPPIECGIGTYTYFLRQAMAETANELHVISQSGASGDNVYQAYAGDEPGLAKQIFDATVKITPDVVHIQHEFGLYGELDGISVLELVYRFKSTGIPVVLTFHTVSADLPYRKRLILNTLTREASAIIVHEEAHVKILENFYQTDRDKINLIPHGAREIEPVPEAKKLLGLEGKKTVLMVGYFRPTKGFDRMLDTFPALVEAVPEASLVIAGKLRRLEFSEYRELLFEKIKNSPANDNIEVFRGQFPQKTFDTIISAADVMVFPYSAGAQSGVMAHALSFGKPIVTSKLPAFINTVKASGAGFNADTDEEYIEALTKLLTDDATYRQCSENAKNYVKNNISWQIVTRKHLDLYKKFEGTLGCNSRYVYVG